MVDAIHINGSAMKMPDEVELEMDLRGAGECVSPQSVSITSESRYSALCSMKPQKGSE